MTVYHEPAVWQVYEPAGNTPQAQQDPQQQWQTNTTAPQATSQVGLGALQPLLANSLHGPNVIGNSCTLKGIQTSLQQLQTATTQHTPNGTFGSLPIAQASGPPSTSTQNMGIGTPATPIGQTPSTVV